MSARYKALRLYVVLSRKLKKHLLGVGVSLFILSTGILTHQNFLWSLPTQTAAERKATEIIKLAAAGEHGKLSLFCNEKSFATLGGWRPDTVKNINLYTTLNGDNAQIKAEVIAPDRVSLGRYFVFNFHYSGIGWQLVSAEDKGKKWQ